MADDVDNSDVLKSTATLELYLRQHYNFPNEFIYLMIDEFQVINEVGMLLKNIIARDFGNLKTFSTIFDN